jgi:hypothetical protein
MHWLNYVRFDYKLTEEVEEKLDDLNLAYVLLDSVDYRDDFPKYSVVQDPYQVQK